MKVSIPTPLRSYTRQQSPVEASGSTLAELLWDLEHQYPGIRFRIVDEQDRLREHIRIFVNRQIVSDLAAPLGHEDSIHIIAAISGG